MNIIRDAAQKSLSSRKRTSSLASADIDFLDVIDMTIIKCLQRDGRTPYTTIAKEVGVSEGAVRNRVCRLLESEVLQIIGVADPIALGYEAHAMIGVKVAPAHDPQEVAHYFQERDEVTRVLFITGRHDLLIEVVCETNGQLAEFVLKHCYRRMDLVSIEPMIGLVPFKEMRK